MNPIQEIIIKTSSKEYPIILNRDFKGLARSILNINGISSVFIITERKLAGLFSKFYNQELQTIGLPVQEIYIRGGEKNKHIGRTAEVYNQLIRSGADRKSLILAIGGGVVGDFAGFIASTFLRGVRFAQIPTSLLACVDSSVGGKVAVNADLGKNMIGSFYQPEFVFAPFSALSTLPRKEWRCGMAEIVKHSLLEGGEYLEKIKNHGSEIYDHESSVLHDFIAESVRFKAKIVGQDERETGLRKTLNLGHTTAHAIESLTKYRKYSHGEAVSIGLLTAMILSSEKEGLDTSFIDLVKSILQNYDLPYRDDSKSKQVALHTLHDKKNVGNSVRFVLLKSPGEAVWDIPVALGEIAEAFRRQKKL
ncbi:3-dehydroquinate synthase [Leptospira fainei serovar Hurstbridge str. BUT 6]|uniref:3-dehydroquinate synthase n=1 Tax=Leptospira fainei serovar Hurstbridge str. BUT 6 TaxID=1193011 RepID=S3V4L7_9LEPT|nr:3-dehydroquinate synthase [Leptospira fainei]EPG76388.1 3-dehydroquinate synthase [Leptospira fainei serovar Hurstbridge str. BUT 6]